VGAGHGDGVLHHGVALWLALLCGLLSASVLHHTELLGWLRSVCSLVLIGRRLGGGALRKLVIHKYVTHIWLLKAPGGLLSSDIAGVRTQQRVRLLAILNFFVL